MRDPNYSSGLVRSRTISAFFSSLVSITVCLTGSTLYAQIVGGPDVNASQKPGPDNECAIAKNPSDGDQLFAACNTGGGGLLAVRSVDGGNTWSYSDPADKTIADGGNGQGAAACCDPTLAWDTFGNLYVGYIGAGAQDVFVLISTDGGLTFNDLVTFPGSVDQPTVSAEDTSAAGVPVAVWLVWSQEDSMRASGAVVTGLGSNAVGAFNTPEVLSGTSSCSFGDVAIAPSGVVVQACQTTIGSAGADPMFSGPTSVLVSSDGDGLGGGNFGVAAEATKTNVGTFDRIPAQFMGSVDAEAGLAYDRLPASPSFGRLYLVYTDETGIENDDTDIMVRYSDDDGASWSNPPDRVNDDDDSVGTIRSQFLPRIASDPQSGNIAVCWHDARNSASNKAMQEYCSFATPTAGTPVFSANVLVGDAPSTSTTQGIEFGDYSGLVYSHGKAHPMWADTSNSTADNPDGTAEFDAYTDGVGDASNSNSDECEPCIQIITVIWIILIVIVIVVWIVFVFCRWFYKGK